MSTIRKRIERGFAWGARIIYHHRLKTLALVFLATAALISNLPKLRVDTSTEGFLAATHPARIAYDAFREQFGRDEVILAAINPPAVFDIKFLEKLKNFHEALVKETPHLDEVTSLISIRNTRGEGDSLIVEDMLKKLPQTPEEMGLLKTRVLNHPLYKNLVISADGSFTSVIIKGNAFSSSAAGTDALAGFDQAKSGAPAAERKFLSEEESREMVEAVRKVAARFNGPDFPISIAGPPVVSYDLKGTMMKDMRKFLLMAASIIAIMLYVIFRRLFSVVVPILIALLSLLATVGLMAATGAPIMMPTQILPSFLLAVGVGASVHILAIMFRRISMGDSKEDAVVYAVGHSGLAVVLTSLTTMAGMGSFAGSELKPLSDLGIFSSAGVFFTLIYTIVMLPALVSITPIRAQARPVDVSRQKLMDRFILAIASFAALHPKKIVAVGLSLFIGSIALASTLHFSHNQLAWFPDHWDIKKATKIVDEKMRGASNMEIVVDTKKENGLYDPQILGLLEAVPGVLEKHLNHPALFVGKTMSLADMVKEINRALHGDDPAQYVIPQDKALIAQELLLFENSGSDDLEDMVDSQFSKARIVVKLPWQDAYIYSLFMKPLEADLAGMFAGKAEVTVTGLSHMFNSTLAATIKSTAQSYFLSTLAITIMMILLIGDVKLGLVAMVPNIIPIVMALALIKILGFPLDMFTMLTGSIALGIAVDDTIHFMHNFRRYHHEENDVHEAIRQTLLSSGRAMIATTVVLSTGFFVFMFASMNNLFNFGLLTGFALSVALLAEFFLTPALMTIVHPKVSKDEEVDWRDEDGLPAEVKAES